MPCGDRRGETEIKTEKRKHTVLIRPKDGSEEGASFADEMREEIRAWRPNTEDEGNWGKKEWVNQAFKELERTIVRVAKDTLGVRETWARW